MRTHHVFATLLAFLVVSALTFSAGQASQDSDTALLKFQDMHYPAVALSLRLQGVVVIKAELSEDGTVKNASALTGHKVLADACVDNIKQWRFRSSKNSTPIVVYNFEIDQLGACHDDSRGLFRLRHYNLATITACTPVVAGGARR